MQINKTSLGKNTIKNQESTVTKFKAQEVGDKNTNCRFNSRDVQVVKALSSATSPSHGSPPPPPHPVSAHITLEEPMWVGEVQNLLLAHLYLTASKTYRTFSS